jgi:hypothetical protein
MAAGTIIGGEVTVAGAVEIGNLGTEAGAPTRIVFGSCPVLEAQLAEADESLAKLKECLAAMTQEARCFSTNAKFLTNDQKERQTEIQFNIHEMQTAIRNVESQKLAAQQAIAQRCAVNVIVHGRLHPNVTLWIADQTYRVDRALVGPIQIGLDASRHVAFRRGTGNVESLAGFLRRIDAPRPKAA